MESENFVVIPNLFLSENPQKLTPDELMIYYLIVQNELKWFDRHTKITINQLASEANLKKNVNQNKNAIKQVLFDLKNKNAIFFEGNELVHYSPLNISFKDTKYYTSLSGFMKGYEMVPFSTFNAARNSDEFYALCLILKSKNGEIAYSTFATLIGICEKSAKKLIQNMLDAGLINKASGRYYRNTENQLRQEINKYDVLMECKSQVEEKLVVSDQNDEKQKSETELIVEGDAHFIENIDWGNWDKKLPDGKFSDLTGHDMYLYHLQKNSNSYFKEQCEKQMDRLKKKKFDFTKLDMIGREILYKKMHAEEELEKTKERLSEFSRMKDAMKNKKKSGRSKDNNIVALLIDDEDDIDDRYLDKKIAL